MKSEKDILELFGLQDSAPRRVKRQKQYMRLSVEDFFNAIVVVNMDRLRRERQSIYEWRKFRDERFRERHDAKVQRYLDRLKRRQVQSMFEDWILNGVVVRHKGKVRRARLKPKIKKLLREWKNDIQLQDLVITKWVNEQPVSLFDVLQWIEQLKH